MISRDASVVVYLTYADTARQRIVEFYEVPFNPARLPLAQFQPDVMLIENCPAFQPALAQVRPDLLMQRTADFYAIRVPHVRPTSARLQ